MCGTNNSLHVFFRLVLTASSFYPGYHGVASILDLETPDPVSDEHTEDEEDWIDEQETTLLSQGKRNKFFDEVCPRFPATMSDPTVTLQRPSWQGTAASAGPPATASQISARDSQRRDRHDSDDDGATATTLLLATESVPPTATVASGIVTVFVISALLMPVISI